MQGETEREMKRNKNLRTEKEKSNARFSSHVLSTCAHIIDESSLAALQDGSSYSKVLWLQRESSCLVSFSNNVIYFKIESDFQNVPATELGKMI